MLFTKAQLMAIMPNATPQNIEAYYEHLTMVCAMYSINTPKRISSFLANVAVETKELSKLEENLNYTTAERLLAVFPRDFKNLADAAQYVRQPERIANRVYANQNGNGPESSGDGWKYRGRGMFHETGKGNYLRRGKRIKQNLIDFPALLCRPDIAALEAADYWDDNKLNKHADVEDIKTIRKKVNGGYNGYLDLLKYWLRARKALGLPDLMVTIDELAKD